VYPYLHTNVEALPMEYSQEPFPTTVTELSRAAHGPDTPFRHWTDVKGYVADMFARNGYPDLVSYNTTVERAEKVGEEWKVTLRRDGQHSDYWWVEWFDAVVVASGHFWVPYIPAIAGLDAYEKARPGSVIHSKHYRGRDLYAGKVRPQLGMQD
jgi:cation diffusion facilitator CzcD-associated flavoprotein CzcO